MASKALRPIRIEGNDAFITLTNGYEAVIDAADVSLVDSWNWFAHVKLRADGSVRTVYAERRETIDGRKATVYLHRVILGADDDRNPDHIDGDGMNNRRRNLRPATQAQNACNRRMRTDNTSGLKGVVWEGGRRSRWRAFIMQAGRQQFLGYFGTKEQAARAYAEASKKLHGDFGRVAAAQVAPGRP